MVRRKTAGVRRKNSAGLEGAYIQEISPTLSAATNQNITAVGDQISLPGNGQAQMMFKLVTGDAARTLTSSPVIAPGNRIGQILCLRGAGSTTTISDGNGANGVNFDGSSKALGVGDWLVMVWTGSVWEMLSYSAN